MAYAFVIDKSFVVTPGDTDLAKTHTLFDVTAAIDGQRVTFRFEWNGYKQFYSIDILDSTGKRIKKWYPGLDDEIVVRNWNALSATRPDAEFRVVDITGQNGPLLPSTLGVTHVILVFLGRVKTL